ncbi:hypothetical protein Vadar_007590 [Vaccinium darrowii]|uniref:Uncharacterized protein n=1 Tax=Vaccinium darrowii TaxID=229202 RepID=A0ACB7Z372_9ERIC|nr:hypothetical protein Vadar_007590 [Vaccinium darrowii]
MSENLKQGVGDQLLHFIQEESAAVFSAESGSRSSRWIYRVPSVLLEGHEKYYMPKTLYFGYFHAWDSILSSADKQKRAHLKGFLYKFPQGTTIEQLIQELEEKSVGDSTDQQLKAFFKGFISRFSQGTTVEQLVDEMMKLETIALRHEDKSSSSADKQKNKSWSSADRQKKYRFRRFIRRFSGGQTIKELIIPFLVGREQEARDYYAGQIFLSSYEFLKIMLLDACYIVETLLSEEYQPAGEEHNIITARSGRLPVVYQHQGDLLKLENQIPFFILRYLYDQVATESKRHSALVGSAISFFQISMPEYGLRDPNIPHEEIRHLLHLVKMALFHSSSTKNKVLEVPEAHSSLSILAKKMGASKLEKSYGIVFAKLENVPLPDIKFENGVLSIPQLVFEESITPALFFNILASEIYSEEFAKGVFTSYVIFMDGLINNEKDVEVLLRSEILKTRTNDVKGLVNFFNELSMHLFTTKRYFHYEGILEEVNKHCNSGPRRLRASWVNNYYEARWEVLNNILLFFLTVTQTIFSGLAYSPPAKKK